MPGSSRTIVQAGQGSPCFDADYFPYGGEHDDTASCVPSYKFEGKERDSETQNDDFGARYYTWRLGRWLSADWSAIPAPVPYANMTNPQTLNLYAMVSDNPETFADLDGHGQIEATTSAGKSQPVCTVDYSTCETAVQIQPVESELQRQQRQAQQQNNKTQTVVTPSSDQTYPSPTTVDVVHREVVYTPGTLYPNGEFEPEFKDTVTLIEKQIGGNSKPVICSKPCSQKGGLPDEIEVANTKSTFRVEQRFKVNGKSVSVARLQNGKIVLSPRQVVDATAKRIIITPEQ
jgi:RHS repeat-associated protein